MQISDFNNQITALLNKHNNFGKNIERREMIKRSVENREALVMECGALATWTMPESTGRNPKDTYIVEHANSKHLIDWTSPNNIPMAPDTFDMLFEDAIKTLSISSDLYEIERVVGADSAYALPVITITNKALSSVFVDNMFRPIPSDLNKSIFAKKPFTLIAVPDHKLNPERYKNRLRTLENGQTSDLAVVIDFERRMGIVYGSVYMGSMTKLIFTIMIY